jgi:hypothetical protein
MTRPTFALPALTLCAALALAACDRAAAPGAESARDTGTTVQAAPPAATASTPMPVAPSGMTNSSTAGRADDLSNSTRASGSTNVYQPPSGDNPAPGGTPSGTAADPASAASQSVTSQSRGTSPPPNSGTLPGGVTGNSGSGGGGGKH